MQEKKKKILAICGWVRKEFRISAKKKLTRSEKFCYLPGISWQASNVDHMFSRAKIRSLTPLATVIRRFCEIIINTSAVSATNLGSMLIFASCVMPRPLIFVDVVLVSIIL